MVLFAVCAFVWWASRGASPGMNAVGTFFATTFGALSVLFYLRHTYRKSEPREPLKPYLLAATSVCVVAVGLNMWASAGVNAEEDVRLSGVGRVTLGLHGPLSGDADYIGPWQALPEVTVVTTSFPSTHAIIFVTSTSSRPDFDVTLVLDDGTEVLCESEKRVNWEQVDGAVRLQADCESVVPKSELEKLRQVDLVESHKVGR